MKFIRQILANTFFVTHWVLGIFYLSGWYFTGIRPLYLVLLIIWPLSWILLGYCFLTKWEFKLRKHDDDTVDTNAEFIRYYAKRFFKLDISTRVVYSAGLLVFAILFILSLAHA
jgi:hypothetical protein